MAEDGGVDAAVEAAVRPAIDFRNAFFRRLDGVYFRRSEQTDEAVAVVDLGGNAVSLTFRGIKRELKLADDDPDSRLLDQIAEGLHYVKALKPGDPLPRELVTREASWEPSDRHRLIAHQRLTIQLVSWLAGDEHVLTNPEELQQVADDPATRKKVVSAFDEAAERLGLGRDRKHEVVEYLERLTVELSYIESLRDTLLAIKTMERKVQGLRKIYGNERSVLELADPVARLMVRAIRQLDELFMQIDAQTCEIMGLLRNIDNHIGYIRMIRDELRKRTMAWDEILETWARVKVKAGPDKPELLREAYRFLAPRFMHVNEWVLMTRLHERKDKEAAGISLLGQGPQQRIKVAKGVMEW